MAVPLATPGWVASGSPPPVGGPGAEHPGGVGRGREAERGPRTGRGGWLGPTVPAAAAGGSPVAAEEGRRRGRGRSRRRSPAPQGKVRRGLPDPGAGSYRASQARGSRRRPAAGGGQRRLPGLAATPGSGPHPSDAPRGGADKAGEGLGRPGGCALWRGGNTACGGGGDGDGRASAGLLGTAGGVGSSSPAGCLGARRLPGLAGARLTKGREQSLRREGVRRPAAGLEVARLWSR